jgi:adenylate kinase family enzyme
VTRLDNAQTVFKNHCKEAEEEQKKVVKYLSTLSEYKAESQKISDVFAQAKTANKVTITIFI